MDGHGQQGYLPTDVNYDDLMNTPSWPGAGDLYGFQQTQPAHGQYSQFGSHHQQPTYDPYELPQQPSYAQPSYSNSPYNAQYQPGRPSEVFGPNSSFLDPQIQHQGGYGSPNSYAFAHQQATTIAPHSLQYSDPHPQSMNGSGPITGYQGSASYLQRPQEHPQQAMRTHSPRNGNEQSTGHALQYSAVPTPTNQYELKQTGQNLSGNNAPQNVPRPSQIKVEPEPDSLRVTHPELLTTKSGARIRVAVAPFLSWHDAPVQIPPGLKNTIPKYFPRLPKSGRDLFPGFDVKAISSSVNINSEKKRIRPPREKKIHVSKYKGTSQLKAPHRPANIRDNNSPNAAARSPVPTETSSSEESSSEEESEYETEDEIPVMDISEVRAATRPADIAAAAGWDAIGVVWKDPNSNPNGETVKTAIEEYAGLVGAIRVQLKANSTQAAATKDAVKQQELERERKVQLEVMYETVNAADKLGYPAIVENLGNHQKLVNGLTTTLIECIKSEDYLGKLPRAIFSLLSKFQTMTDDLLKRLKFDGIQKRWLKKGDEAIKKNIASILANTVDAREKTSKGKKEATTKVEQDKKLPEKLEPSKVKLTEAVKTVPSTKRSHEGDANNGKPNKKFASDVAGVPGSATLKTAPPKRNNLLANNLLGISTKAPPKLPPKKREPSPPQESKLGALLASIAKPVEVPKAPSAPARPAETPEEKKRRERKESRRHLRVRFKEGQELEQIRLFKHEQAEDEGRQDDMLRDAHDLGSEGMMHKKRVSETMESLEEDDGLPSDIEDRPYPQVRAIDLSGLERESRHGQHLITRGGLKSFTTPEQSTQEKREGQELMAVYTDVKDIPPSPREPHPSETGPVDQDVPLKAPTEPWIAQRLMELEQYGLDNASQLFVRRSEERKFKEIRDNQARGINSSFSTPQSQNHNPNLAPNMHNQENHLAAAWDNLTRIVNQIKGKPYPATEPPAWMTNEAQRADWWAGYNRDRALSGQDIQTAPAPPTHYQPPPMMAHPNQQMPGRPVQPYAPHPQAPQPNMTAPPMTDTNAQVQAYLAAYGVAPPQPADQASHQRIEHASWNGPEKRAQHDEYDDWDEAHSRKKQNTGKRGYDMPNWNGAFGNDSPFDENGEYKGKKKPCKYYQSGKCTKGDKCTYSHEFGE